MPIPFSCRCGRSYSVKDQLAGCQVRCKCGLVSTLPAFHASQPAVRPDGDWFDELMRDVRPAAAPSAVRSPPRGGNPAVAGEPDASPGDDPPECDQPRPRIRRKRSRPSYETQWLRNLVAFPFYLLAFVCLVGTALVGAAAFLINPTWLPVGYTMLTLGFFSAVPFYWIAESLRQGRFAGSKDIFTEDAFDDFHFRNDD